MISIKKHIERNAEDLFRTTLAAYSSALNAVAQSGIKACPPVGSKLRDSLLNLQAELSIETTPAQLQKIGEKVDTHLDEWGADAADYFKQRAGEIKELLLILARTAELTGERDQRYRNKFQDFTGRLETLAGLHDLAALKQSLLKSAIDLKACAEAMVDESQKSIAGLRKDVGEYQARLDQAERLACRDALTGLHNRRGVQSALESAIAQNRKISVLFIDLSDFKKMNDKYGHAAGDEILKQFSAELKSYFRENDLVGRWGGDEFVVVLEGDLKGATSHRERVASWVFGDYTIRVGDIAHKVAVQGAIGAAEWQTGDTFCTLIEHADLAMYEDKRSSKSHR